MSAAQRVKFAFDQYVLTWTLGSFASSDAQSPIVSFPWGEDEVYFAEATSAELRQEGRGKGTFEQGHMDSSTARTKSNGTVSDTAHLVPSGEVLR